jgi:lysophospholipase-3
MRCLLVIAALLCAVALATSIRDKIPAAEWKAAMLRAAETRASAQATAAAFRAANPTHDASSLAPVILVPGLGGSELEAKLHRFDVPAWYCSKDYDWYTLWISIEEVIASPCLLSNLGITYNSNNNTYSNVAGVQIRALDWGGLNGINCLDNDDGSWICGLTAYYQPISTALEGIGYVAGTNLYGAPYDWRLGTDYLYTTVWAQNFTALIEDAYTANGNQAVHLITHSMGGPTVLYFLNQKSQQWKDQYVASFVPIAGPWSGSPKALGAVVAGDNFGAEIFGMSLLDRSVIANISRMSGGVMELVPNANYYNETWDFIVTPSKGYDDEEFPQLFSDLGLQPATTALYQHMAPLIDSLSHPNINTYCLYGYGLETPYQYVFANDFAPGVWQEASQINSDNFGDGTVPLESLQLCNTWDGIQPDQTACREYDLSGHIAILTDEELLADLLNIVTGKFGAMTCNTPTLDNYLATNPKFKKQ